MITKRKLMLPALLAVGAVALTAGVQANQFAPSDFDPTANSSNCGHGACAKPNLMTSPTSSPTATADPAATSAPAPTAGTTTSPAPAPTSAPSASTSPTSTPTSTASSAPTTNPVVPLGSTGQPNGPTGNWAMTFDDEFSGSSLDTNNWAPYWFSSSSTMNNVVTNPANVRVANGELVLNLASATDGALVSTNPKGGAKTGFQFTYGYAEARIYFPGSGSTVYNWPAFWTDGQSWPNNGEIDIAEGLGTMTTNYHSSSGASNSGTIPGTWAAGYHTYGVDRQPGKNDIYFDGKLVRSYSTNDAGAPHYLILNVGNSNTHVYGPGSEVKVDYVRAWQRA